MGSKMPNIRPPWFMKPPADQKTSPAPPPPKPPPLKPSLYSAFDAEVRTPKPPPLRCAPEYCSRVDTKTVDLKSMASSCPEKPQEWNTFLRHKIDGLDELTKAIVSLKETMERCETRLANIQADLEFTRFPEIKK